MANAKRYKIRYEPFERDITTYATIGQGILDGKVPYRDLWDHKPPLIFFIYVLFQLAFGQTDLAIFALNVLASVGIVVAIYAAVKQVGSTVNALWAAAAWTAISGYSPFRQTSQTLSSS